MNKYKLIFEWKRPDGKWSKTEDWCYHDTAQGAYNHLCSLISEEYDEWRDYGLHKLGDFGWDRVQGGYE